MRVMISTLVWRSIREKDYNARIIWREALEKEFIKMENNENNGILTKELYGLSKLRKKKHLVIKEVPYCWDKENH